MIRLIWLFLPVFFGVHIVRRITPAAAVSLLVLGCSPYKDIPLATVAGDTPRSVGDAPPASVSYRISAGDLLEVKYPFHSEFDEVVRVRPDGFVSIPFVGELRVAGDTPTEFETVIKQHFEQLFVADGTQHKQRRYLLSPNDELRIVFPFRSEFNQEEVVVRPDGRISLPLIDSVLVQGMTPEQLQATLIEAYAKHLRKPPAITVIVTRFSSNRFEFGNATYPGEVAELQDVVVIVREAQQMQIYVGGEVGLPAPVAYRPGMTVRQAVISAGGATGLGDLENVLLITKRNGVAGRVSRVDLVSPLKGNEWREAELRPFDIVLVPKTGIARLNSWMDQHLYDLFPFLGNSSFAFTYELDRQDTITTNIR